MKSIKKCDHCNTDFQVESKYIKFNEKNGWKMYCSKECRTIAKKRSISLECHICKKKIEKSPSQYKKSISGKVFCSRKCSTTFTNSEYKSGEKHPNYIDGISSYRERKLRSQENICRDCGNSDLRVLEIHHIDKNRRNNCLENLVILCANCHKIRHYENVV